MTSELHCAGCGRRIGRRGKVLVIASSVTLCGDCATSITVHNRIWFACRFQTTPPPNTKRVPTLLATAPKKCFPSERIEFMFNTPTTDQNDAESPQTDQFVPLQLLAGEWGLKPEALVRDIGTDRIIIDDLGVRFIRRDDARELRERRQRQAARQAEADEAWRAELVEQSRALHERVQAIQQRDAALRATGLDPDIPALAIMTAGDHEARMDRAGQHFDEALAAGRRGEYGVMHRLPPT